MVNPDRDTSAVINDCDGIIFVDCYFDSITKACQCFIYRIIHNFIDKMMQSSAGCGADVHTGTLSDSLKSFENLYLIRAILVIHCCIVHCFFAHSNPHFCLLLVAHTGDCSFRNFKNLIYLKPVIHKLLQTCTGNNGLNISYTV